MFVSNVAEGKEETSILESSSLINAENKSNYMGSVLMDTNPIERLSLSQDVFSDKMDLIHQYR